MNSRMTQQLVARHGCVLRPRVPREVFVAISALAERQQARVDRAAASILEEWWDDVRNGDRRVKADLDPEVLAALTEHAAAAGMSVSAAVAQIVGWWHEDVKKAALRAASKGATGGG